jgi:squalene-hopene/tetraprenyl-beta-curcumene cyclase
MGVGVRRQGQVGAALQRTLDWLAAAQVHRNHWAGRLSSSALATAIAIVALHLTDREAYQAQIQAGRRWLFATQHEDGGWGDAVVDRSNINATSLAIGALMLIGPAEADSQQTPSRSGGGLGRGLECLEQMGGWEAVGDPKRCTLSGPCRTVAALAGIMEWKTIKRLRPEVVLIPARLRKTISTTFPAYLTISTLHSTRAFDVRNHLPTYSMARRRVLDWLRQAQGPNGSFEESAFLSSVIIACLTAAGEGQMPWLRPALEFVLGSQRDDGGWPIDRDLETFDTDMAVTAFVEAGRPVPGADDIERWLRVRQFQEVCFPTGATPGGWAWAMPAGWPECDDTSYTVLALLQLGVKALDPAIQAGLRWLEGMQNSDGSWSTFVRNSRMPFDHDCPYITGHVLSALGRSGRIKENPRPLERALTYLRRVQRPDGSFASIWFRERTAGAASVIEGLCDGGYQGSELVAGARRALLANQNGDGGWGGVRGADASTAEETAWAVLALLRVGSPELTHAISRGVDWLVEHQRSDGTWSEWPIGLYYSAMWYSDSFFAITLPAQALARAQR